MNLALAPTLSERLEQPSRILRHQEFLETHRKQPQSPNLTSGRQFKQADIETGGAHERVGQVFGKVIERIECMLTPANFVEEDQVSSDIQIDFEALLEIGDDCPRIQAPGE